MRLVVVSGLVLIGAGAFVLLRGLTYTSERSVLKVGDLQASVEERHTVPSWLGAVALVGGAVLVVAGRRRIDGSR